MKNLPKNLPMVFCTKCELQMEPKRLNVMVRDGFTNNMRPSGVWECPSCGTGVRIVYGRPIITYGVNLETVPPWVEIGGEHEEETDVDTGD